MWGAFMELWNTRETELSTTLLALPAAAHPDQGAGRFLAFTQMLSKSLLVFGTDQVFRRSTTRLFHLFAFRPHDRA